MTVRLGCIARRNLAKPPLARSRDRLATHPLARDIGRYRATYPEAGAPRPSPRALAGARTGELSDRAFFSLSDSRLRENRRGWGERCGLASCLRHSEKKLTLKLRKLAAAYGRNHLRSSMPTESAWPSPRPKGRISGHAYHRDMSACARGRTYGPSVPVHVPPAGGDALAAASWLQAAGRHCRGAFLGNEALLFIIRV